MWGVSTSPDLPVLVVGPSEHGVAILRPSCCMLKGKQHRHRSINPTAKDQSHNSSAHSLEHSYDLTTAARYPAFPTSTRLSHDWDAACDWIDPCIPHLESTPKSTSKSNHGTGIQERHRQGQRARSSFVQQTQHAHVRPDRHRTRHSLQRDSLQCQPVCARAAHKYTIPAHANRKPHFHRPGPECAHRQIASTFAETARPSHSPRTARIARQDPGQCLEVVGEEG